MDAHIQPDCFDQPPWKLAEAKRLIETLPQETFTGYTKGETLSFTVKYESDGLEGRPAVTMGHLGDGLIEVDWPEGSTDRESLWNMSYGMAGFTWNGVYFDLRF